MADATVVTAIDGTSRSIRENPGTEIIILSFAMRLSRMLNVNVRSTTAFIIFTLGALGVIVAILFKAMNIAPPFRGNPMLEFIPQEEAANNLKSTELKVYPCI